MGIFSGIFSLSQVGFDHLGVVLDFSRGSSRQQRTQVEHVDALTPTQIHHHVHVMLDHDDGVFHGGMNSTDELDQIVAFIFVHARGRFVQQEQLR